MMVMELLLLLLLLVMLFLALGEDVTEQARIDRVGEMRVFDKLLQVERDLGSVQIGKVGHRVLAQQVTSGSVVVNTDIVTTGATHHFVRNTTTTTTVLIVDVMRVIHLR